MFFAAQLALAKELIKQHKLKILIRGKIFTFLFPQQLRCVSALFLQIEGALPGFFQWIRVAALDPFYDKREDIFKDRP